MSNVGGQHFVTTRTTLCAEDGLLLSHLFRSDSQFTLPKEISSGDDDDDHDNSKSTNGGEVFLDRNPFVFGYILDYLRDGCQVTVDLSNRKELLQRLRTDADYYSLEGLVLYCDTKLHEAMAESVRRDEKEHWNKVYDYCRVAECVPPDPGGKLVKVTARRYYNVCKNSACEESDCEYDESSYPNEDHEKWEESYVFEKERQQQETDTDTDTDTVVKKEKRKIYEYELSEEHSINKHYRMPSYHIVDTITLVHQYWYCYQ